jgi:hypothetical protein
MKAGLRLISASHAAVQWREISSGVIIGATIRLATRCINRSGKYEIFWRAAPRSENISAGAGSKIRIVSAELAGIAASCCGGKTKTIALLGVKTA